MGSSDENQKKREQSSRSRKTTYLREQQLNQQVHRVLEIGGSGGWHFVHFGHLFQIKQTEHTIDGLLHLVKMDMSKEYYWSGTLGPHVLERWDVAIVKQTLQVLE